MASIAPGLTGSTSMMIRPQLKTAEGPVICVFCGASPGKSPAHMEAARSLAQVFHDNNVSLVYGGGTVGLMGELAKTLVSLSGNPQSVHGIIPEALVRHEKSYDATNPLSETINEKIYGRTTIVKDMHTRKQMMAKLVLSGGIGSGFVALSGGYGTLEELMEIITWNQLGIHKSGVVMFNVEGYWDGLLAWIKRAVEAGFVGEGNRGIVVEAKTAIDVVRSLKEYQVAQGRFDLKWN